MKLPYILVPRLCMKCFYMVRQIQWIYFSLINSMNSRGSLSYQLVCAALNIYLIFRWIATHSRKTYFPVDSIRMFLNLSILKCLNFSVFEFFSVNKFSCLIHIARSFVEDNQNNQFPVSNYEQYYLYRQKYWSPCK